MSSPSKRSAESEDCPLPKKTRRTSDGAVPGQSTSEGEQETGPEALDVCVQPSGSGSSYPVPATLPDYTAININTDSSDENALPYPEASTERIYNAVKEVIERMNDRRQSYIEISDEDVPAIILSSTRAIIKKVIDARDFQMMKFYHQMLVSKMQELQDAFDKFCEEQSKRSDDEGEGNEDK